jgi:hypothetical protein
MVSHFLYRWTIDRKKKKKQLQSVSKHPWVGLRNTIVQPDVSLEKCLSPLPDMGWRPWSHPQLQPRPNKKRGGANVARNSPLYAFHNWTQTRNLLSTFWPICLNVKILYEKYSTSQFFFSSKIVSEVMCPYLIMRWWSIFQNSKSYSWLTHQLKINFWKKKW